MTASIVWTSLAIAIAAILFWGINDKNNNLKHKGVDDNFIIND